MICADGDDDVRIADECERTGEYVPVEDEISKFSEDLKARLAARERR
jgi:hypothetical protein